MFSDNRNLIIAVVLSLAVVLGWQYFIAGPRIEQARKEQALSNTIAVQQNGATPTANSGSPTAATPGAPALPAEATILTREQALQATPRVAIETPAISGSINLKGGRLDDVRLLGYTETVDPKSPTIVLLSPSNAANGYFTEFGWIAPAGGATVPGPETLWTAPANAKLTPTTPVTLTFDNGAGLTFHRTISVDPSYMFTVKDDVANATGQPVSLSAYGRVTRVGEPVVAGNYILHEGPLGWMGDQTLQSPSYKDLTKQGSQTFENVSAGWLGFTDKYWAATIVPRSGAFDAHFSHVAGANPLYQADYKSAPIAIAAGGTASTENLVFAGAKQVSIVNDYANNLKIGHFDLLIDWGYLWFLTKPMFALVDYIYKLIGNFGIAIMVVTVLVKAVFFPLANKSYKSMSGMKKVQPEMAALRERYADDKVKQQQALMELYKREKINPIAGCWPVLIQIPVFFSLYKVIFITIEMRHAPFFGWIQDLSAPDPTNLFTLFGLIPWTPPSLLMIGIWPLIMGVTMFVQMRLNPAPADPAQQAVFTWMPVIFTFMLGRFPAGLVIYWSWNNTLSVLQQYVIMRRQGVEVNLLGNITSTFKKKPKTAVVEASKAKG